MYKILITTSGSRLGELTAKTNKSLVLLNKRPVINYIVDLYSPDIESVITLGYFGYKIRDYLIKAYPGRKFTFVWVDKYQGDGSSLGYSMLRAKDKLQCPFIFHCNDTIIKGSLPSPEKFNWNGGSKGLDPELFNTKYLSSFTIKDGYMKQMNRKGASEWDLFHIGLVGLKDYKDFWSALGKLYNANPNDSSLNDCAAMQLMVNKGIKFKAIELKKWYDTGNLANLNFTRDHYSSDK